MMITAKKCNIYTTLLLTSLMCLSPVGKCKGKSKDRPSGASSTGSWLWYFFLPWHTHIHEYWFYKSHSMSRKAHCDYFVLICCKNCAATTTFCRGTQCPSVFAKCMNLVSPGHVQNNAVGSERKAESHWWKRVEPFRGRDERMTLNILAKEWAARPQSQHVRHQSSGMTLPSLLWLQCPSRRGTDEDLPLKGRPRRFLSSKAAYFGKTLKLPYRAWIVNFNTETCA